MSGFRLLVSKMSLVGEGKRDVKACQDTIKGLAPEEAESDLWGGEEEEAEGEEASSLDVLLQSFLVEIMKLRKLGVDVVLSVWVCGSEDYPGSAAVDVFLSNLGRIKEFSLLKELGSKCDIVLRLNKIPLSEDIFLRRKEEERQLYRALYPGGVLISLLDFSLTGKSLSSLKARWWSRSEVTQRSTAPKVTSLQRASVDINYTAALYWARTESACLEESSLLSEVTIALSHSERSLSAMSNLSHKRAVGALENHGLVIIRGLFDEGAISSFREWARSDMALCEEELKGRGIDLRRPKGDVINNFDELSMREAFRCDLRRGPNTTYGAAAMAGEVSEEHGGVSTAGGRQRSLRNHPSVLRLLQEVMCPRGKFAGGDWGRWNFGGKGPDAEAVLERGEVCAVVTLPGALDQTLHADAPHLFTHLHLPPHYVNLFLPSISNDDDDDDDDESHRNEHLAAGQTAFVIGSHKLEASFRMMGSAAGEEEIIRQLVRPHLSAGDCLLFDCRLLHFGLANTSADIVRPTLYVNYHRDFFHDPKNWNASDRLLSDKSPIVSTSSI